MKKILGSLILAGAFLAGCSSDDNGGSCTKTTCAAQNATCGSISDGCGGQLACGNCSSGLTCGTGSSGSIANVCGFAQPSGTVAVDFTVDDTANKQWQSQELEWKGAMLYDTATRKVTYDSTWAGPWAKLYDDGPWNRGGHEPNNAVAGDHKLGVTVFVTPPATGSQTYEYGLRDATNPDPANGGWVWVGSNGSFTVNAGATAAITAAGQTFPAHGTVDLRLTIDTHNLGAGTWDTSRVAVKGSAWGWSEVDLHDDGTHGDATSGDGIYTYVLSQNLNQNAPPYPGLLKSGDRPEFIFVFGTAPNSKEYKDSSAVAEKTGVTAGTKAASASDFTNQTLQITGGTGLGSGNTFIEVP